MVAAEVVRNTIGRRSDVTTTQATTTTSVSVILVWLVTPTRMWGLINQQTCNIEVRRRGPEATMIAIAWLVRAAGPLRQNNMFALVWVWHTLWYGFCLYVVVARKLCVVAKACAISDFCGRAVCVGALVGCLFVCLLLALGCVGRGHWHLFDA